MLIHIPKTNLDASNVLEQIFTFQRPFRDKGRKYMFAEMVI